MDNKEIKVLMPKDVQKIMRLGKNKTMETFHRDDFPCYRIGSNFYILEEDFIDWLKNQKK